MITIIKVQRIVICQGQHKITDCKQFMAQTTTRRWEVVKELKLSFACLQPGHTIRVCKLRKQCIIEGCTRNHHKLLHSIDNDAAPSITSVILYSGTKSINTYALLDEGASITLIDDSLISELEIEGTKRSLNVNWFGGKTSRESTRVVNLQISGAESLDRYDLTNVYGVKNIQLPIQTLQFESKNNGIWKRVPINQYTNAKPLILIGLDHCHLSVPAETVEMGLGGPYASKTKLDWVVFGPVMTNQTKNICLFMKPNDEELHKLLADYFETESFGVRPSPPVENKEDVTGLLWKDDLTYMADSYDAALKRLQGIERKMQSDVQFSDTYKNIMSSYVEKGYARKLSTEEIHTNKPRIWYLPHFAVQNPNKPGKLRMVFDAAAKVKDVSLNSCLIESPLEYRPVTSQIWPTNLTYTNTAIK